MEYYKARSWSNDTVNALMAWMTDNQASGEDAAIYFLQNNEDLWKEWLPEDVAERSATASTDPRRQPRIDREGGAGLCRRPPPKPQ